MRKRSEGARTHPMATVALPPPNRPPFAGGAFLPSRGAPVDVRGADIGGGDHRGPSPLAGVRVTGPPNAARPNRGSNITIPVSRLVHQTKKRDRAAAEAGAPIVAETDHLHDGALVFVMGDDAMLSKHPDQPPRMPMAKGVAQFSRVCSFPALEAFYRVELSAKSVRLDTKLVDLEASLKAKRACALHAYVVPNGASADDSMLAVADLSLPSLKVGGEAERQAQGLFAMDDGPFLRAKGGRRAMVPAKESRDAVVSRTAGDDAALGALDAAMACVGLKSWVPDGILLSTGDSSGDTAMDDALTGRDGLLLNTAVYGPATTDAFFHGERRMDALPGDRLFVCLVADAVTYDKAAEVTDKNLLAVETRVNRWVAGEKARQKALRDATTEKARRDLASAQDAERKARIPDVLHVYTKRCDPASPDHDKAKAAAARTAYAQVRAQEFARVPVLYKAERDAYLVDAVAEFQKTGADVRPTILTNFRVMKTTSGQLAEQSFAGKPLNLPGPPPPPKPKGNVYGPNKDLPPADPLAQPPNWFAGVSGAVVAERPPAGPGSRKRMGLQRSASVSELIVGGWCIGTVTDNNAVRSFAHGPRPKPAAIRASVDIKWWTGDRLWRTFMNKQGMSRERGQSRAVDAPTDAADAARTALRAQLGRSGDLRKLRAATALLNQANVGEAATQQKEALQAKVDETNKAVEAAETAVAAAEQAVADAPDDGKAAAQATLEQRRTELATARAAAQRAADQFDAIANFGNGPYKPFVGQQGEDGVFAPVPTPGGGVKLSKKKARAR